jgi:hypothetical protein
MVRDHTLMVAGEVLFQLAPGVAPTLSLFRRNHTSFPVGTYLKLPVLKFGLGPPIRTVNLGSLHSLQCNPACINRELYTDQII